MCKNINPFVKLFCVLLAVLFAISCIYMFTTCNSEIHMCFAHDVVNTKYVDKQLLNISDNSYIVNIIYDRCSRIYEYDNYTSAVSGYNQTYMTEYNVMSYTTSKSINGTLYHECLSVDNEYKVWNYGWWSFGVIIMIFVCMGMSLIIHYQYIKPYFQKKRQRRNELAVELLNSAVV